MTDFENIPQKKPKASVSLSLDKENVDFLKEDIGKYGDGITLSSVFDFLLNDFINIRKKTIEKQRQQKNQENVEKMDKKDVKKERAESGK